MKTLLLILTLVVGIQAQARIESHYDRFTDRTTVTARFFKVYRGVNMQALYHYQGRADRIVPPDSVYLDFIVVSDAWFPFSESAKLNVISDETLFEFRREIGSSQTARVGIPFSEFEKLLKGKRVEMRFSGLELQLSDGDIDLLRSFIPKRSVSP